MSKEENSAKSSPQWILLQQNSAKLILIECKAVQWELDIAYIQQSMTKLEKTIPKRLPKEIKLWILWNAVEHKETSMNANEHQESIS